MTCTNCKHRITTDKKTRCELCGTTVYAVGDFNLGAGFKKCRFEPLGAKANKTTTPKKKTVKKAVATAEKEKE